MDRNQRRIYIGLGSNLGDSRKYLAQAIQSIIESIPGRFEASPVYHSEPVEYTDQPWFFNQVISLETDAPMTPLGLLKILQEIERNLGRNPTFRYGPRVIDLDILFYGNWVLQCAQLWIPHPKITERSFVLLPLVDLDPAWIHPCRGQRMDEILAQNIHRLSLCQKDEIGAGG